MKIYQFETITGTERKTVGNSTFVSMSFVQDTINKFLETSDKVIVTVWKNGFEVVEVTEYEKVIMDEVEQLEEITFTVEEKNGKFIHTIQQGNDSFTRTSKKQYNFAIIQVDSKGEIFGVHGYRTSLQSAENEAKQWAQWYKKNDPIYTTKIIEAQ